MSNKQSSWRPSAEMDILKKRANILATIRQFFYEKGVMEVETPSLSHSSVTDPHLYSFVTHFMGDREKPLFLQTSPEFHMKRLLAAGSGAIYQIGKAFRDEESGRHHNPEFTILEWYRPDFDHFNLMAEVAELVQLILKCPDIKRLSYQDAFMQYLQLDPLNIDLEQLQAVVLKHSLGDWLADETDPDTLLQCLFSQCIEPLIGLEQPCFIYHFPASQAALAKRDLNDPRIAHRFELYYQGIELVNGFNELTDANEQKQRFEQDNLKRKNLNRPTMVIDLHLLQALDAGLPDCAGVALGVDRLVMLALNCTHINQVLPFPVDIA